MVIKGVEISIKSLLRGAREAEGSVVVIDVFKTGSLIVTLLDRGVRAIVPTLTRAAARERAAELAGAILFGERLGWKPAGFHYNISPSAASQLDLAQKTIILSTTNGTLGLLSAVRAEEVVVGSFLNAGAVARYLSVKRVVTLVPIGVAYGSRRAIEDELCAELIRSRLLGISVDFDSVAERIRRDLSSRLRNIGQSSDVAFSLNLDQVDVVPVLTNGVLVAKRC